jgi:hypothetical protein
VAKDDELHTILLIGLLMIIGLCLTPSISTQVLGVTGVGQGNLTSSAAKALIVLVPVLWVILVLTVCILAIVVELRRIRHA